MRVLFLDVDGVLNRDAFEPPDATGLADWVEPELAARLTALARDTDAVLVLSSSWREDESLDDLRAELRRAGIDVPLLDVTPVRFGEPRWAEIHAWCQEHAPTRFAILDDLPDMGPLSAYHVRVDSSRGLDEAAVSAARRLLAG